MKLCWPSGRACTLLHCLEQQVAVRKMMVMLRKGSRTKVVKAVMLLLRGRGVRSCSINNSRSTWEQGRMWQAMAAVMGCVIEYTDVRTPA
jgi:hypothetical protein